MFKFFMAYSSSFFYLKHFLVEKSVRGLVYFLTPNRQYIKDDVTALNRNKKIPLETAPKYYPSKKKKVNVDFGKRKTQAWVHHVPVL